MNPAGAIALFRQAFEQEERGAFDRLARIPDTHVRRFLHAYRQLAPEETERVKSALATRAAKRLYPDDITVTSAETDALETLREQVIRESDWQFIPLKTLKMSAGFCQSKHPKVQAQLQGYQMPERVLGWVNGLTTCKAAELRKLVKFSFQRRFGLKAENEGGGVWAYRRAEGNGPFEVEIDYGGTWGQQLRYWVHVNEPRFGGWVRRVNYESLIGVGVGDWDFITEGQADQCIALLTDLVDETVKLVRRAAG